MKKIIVFLMLISLPAVYSQEIPQHVSYYRIYDFLDELTTEGIIELNTAIKPYSRNTILEQLLIAQNSKKLTARQKKEVDFFLNDLAIERGELPSTRWNIFKNKNLKAALLSPGVYYRDSVFKARLTPALGLNVLNNSTSTITQRWIGADFQASIGKNISIYGSIRDLSNNGERLSGTTYLNDQPGYQYKEASYGGDFSDSRGGIKLSNKWGSIGIVKDNIVWGDNYHGSNILSGRAPSFPMISLNLKPVKWFELNYIHASLVSNVYDSTYYYVENGERKWYRPANKFMAANMITITPVRNLRISIGNSIIYAERTIQAAYLIPIAFYKSIDHTLTKGLGTENQNSQIFFNLSSRNIKKLHLYSSVFIDEFSFDRLNSSNKEANPVSIKAGASTSNILIDGLSATLEYTRSNILNYKHSIPLISYTSNGYNMGHYLGDNSQEIYAQIMYKPLRGLDLKAYYVNAKHGNEYDYIRRGTSNGITGNVEMTISQPSLGEIIWKNQTFGLNATYEPINNGYVFLKIEKSNIETFEPVKSPAFGENRKTASEYMNYFSPLFYQGDKLTISAGFSFGF
ncbi:MAG: capsule assembly Wzi family protein [Paludibacter sp.]